MLLGSCENGGNFYFIFVVFLERDYILSQIYARKLIDRSYCCLFVELPIVELWFSVGKLYKHSREKELDFFRIEDARLND